MVKIDTVVCAPEQAKKLIQSNHINETSASESEKNRFKLVDLKNRCGNCLFYIFKPFLNKTAICLFIMIAVIVASIAFVVPLICYIECLVATSFSNNARDVICTNTTVHRFKYTVRKVDVKPEPLTKQCYSINNEDRIDCLPQKYVFSYLCHLKNCCWSVPKNGSIRTPHCYYPSGYRSYKYINVSATDMGAVAYLSITINSTYPRNVPVVRIDFNYRTEDVLQIKIYDAVRPRFQPMFPELPTMGPTAAKNTKYIVDIDTEKIGFRVLRKSNNQTIFNTQDVGAFIFSDQMLEISSRLPTHHIYGLGQQKNDFKLNMVWNKITLFNHNQIPRENSNLYGSHPFYLAMEEDGLSNGVMLLNSNAMDITLTPSPAITYRTIGGILDFYFFLGPSPSDVVRQYTGLVGRPFMPPYWSLGFHLSRFGLKTLDETKDLWNRTWAAKIPFDTMWNDIDYMQDRNDFTYSKERFQGLPEFVNLLHKRNMHYMIALDPGVSGGELPGEYPPFDTGIAQQIFVSDISGYRPFLGKVWNKKITVFVDFFKPASVSYWLNEIRQQHNVFAFDGVWIGMNDPTNFLNGTKIGCPNTTLDFPPYLPAVDGEKLFYRTICMSAKHHNRIHHYNVHNIYGLVEAIVTSFAMQQIREKRAFVVSRSSFLGLGRYAGVWTGDINSTWDDMAHSISDILSFSLFGIPMSGADICGFNGNATVALCRRWSQLGAFYPFSRNHNSDQSSDQDPVALGPEVEEAARKSLLIRYSLLPYLYTLFWQAHTNGDTVARPLFFEFPEDVQTFYINTQFLWGPALMIAPVLKDGWEEVNVYLPGGRWYDFYSYQLIHNNETGATLTLPAPLDTIPLLLRGGYVIPTQRPELTTFSCRDSPLDLLIPLDDKGEAVGYLYWDDGDSLEHNDDIYSLLKFVVANKKLYIDVLHWQYNDSTLLLGEVKIIGVDSLVVKVTVNGKAVDFDYKTSAKANKAVLYVSNLNRVLNEAFELVWHEE